MKDLLLAIAGPKSELASVHLHLFPTMANVIFQATAYSISINLVKKKAVLIYMKIINTSS